MEVILLERVAKLGQMGEIVKVRDGFARNFLLKRGKALRGTADNREKFDRIPPTAGLAGLMPTRGGGEHPAAGAMPQHPGHQPAGERDRILRGCLRSELAVAERHTNAILTGPTGPHLCASS